MEDRRQHPRKRCSRPLAVYDINRDTRVGFLADISLGGLMLMSATPQPINRVLQLRLDFPEAIAGREDLELGAESLWTELSNDQRSYWSGFAIIDISPEDKVRLAQLINEYL